jgi:thioesterase domain-containing protein
MAACMSPLAFTEYLHRNIPLTAAMQLRVLHSDGGSIELAAPLAPNRNHQHSAFGGALATLGIVSGWALLQQNLQSEGIEARVVVQKSDCEFVLPAAAEFTAAGSLPEDWPRFLDTLRKRGRARITVQSVLRSAGQEVMRHSGTFVAMQDAATPGEAP